MQSQRRSRLECDVLYFWILCLIGVDFCGGVLRYDVWEADFMCKG
jgi:hypothetical protein